MISWLSSKLYNSKSHRGCVEMFYPLKIIPSGHSAVDSDGTIRIVFERSKIYLSEYLISTRTDALLHFVLATY